jgi:hypothetical protein
VDDTVEVRGRLLEPAEIIEAAAAHLRAERGHRRGGRVRPQRGGVIAEGRTPVLLDDGHGHSQDAPGGTIGLVVLDVDADAGAEPVAG